MLSENPFVLHSGTNVSHNAMKQVMYKHCSVTMSCTPPHHHYFLLRKMRSWTLWVNDSRETKSSETERMINILEGTIIGV